MKSKHIIDNLKNYMFYKYPDSTELKSHPVSVVKNNLLKNIPNNNPLLWYIYIAVYGESEYDINKKYLFQTEQKFKIDTIEYMRTKNKTLKDNKINILETESNILNDKYISLKTFKALCILYNVSFLIIQNNIYYDFKFSETYNYIVEIKNGKYLIDNYSEQKYNLLSLSNKLHVNIDKPLYSIGSYKLDELKQMVIKLDIEPKKTKKENYNEIVKIFGKLKI